MLGAENTPTRSRVATDDSPSGFDARRGDMAIQSTLETGRTQEPFLPPSA